MVCGNNTKLKRQIFIKHFYAIKLQKDIRGHKKTKRQNKTMTNYIKLTILIQLYLQCIINFYLANFFKICKV